VRPRCWFSASFRRRCWVALNNAPGPGPGAAASRRHRRRSAYSWRRCCLSCRTNATVGIIPAIAGPGRWPAGGRRFGRRRAGFLHMLGQLVEVAEAAGSLSGIVVFVRGGSSSRSMPGGLAQTDRRAARRSPAGCGGRQRRLGTTGSGCGTAARHGRCGGLFPGRSITASATRLGLRAGSGWRAQALHHGLGDDRRLHRA
jgi:hypothetical protein